MTIKVKAYLAGTVALGLVVFAQAESHWACANPLRLLIYLVLAAWAGSLKVRLPGMTGTYSLNFIFVLIGIADLSFGETVLIATLSMIAQSVWRTKKPPRLEQVVFNANAVAISAASAFLAARFTPLPALAQLAVAAGAYYLVNTAIVSGILGLVEEKSFSDVWSGWFRWSFTYYLMGVCTVAAIVSINHRYGWTYPLVLLPFMYLEYFYLRSDLDHHDLSSASG
jgi:hypothetical protein